MASKLGSAVWQIRTNYKLLSVNNYPISKTTGLFFGHTSGGTSNPHGAVMSTQEMWNFDKKIDDGRPAYGSIMTFRKGATATWATTTADCSNNTDPALAEYDLQREGLSCAAIVLLK